jgi:electron transfer flavoprotein beta subunit
MKMEILVCVKRVPDSAENEIEVKADGSDIKRDDLVYSVNEWDNYAVEEAIQIVDRVGGSVTVASIGNDEAEEVVRREMAMGANQGLLLVDPAFEGSDGRGIAAILKAAVQKGKYDMVLTGAQADDGAAQVGGMLAALLDWPYASLVNKIETQDGQTLKIGREIEGGNQEINEIEMPCVLSIQTGINEPRYVGIRGIRKVASVEIPVMNAASLGVDPAAVGQANAGVKRVDYFVPPAGAGAEILQGSTAEIAAKLLDLLKAKGGLK